MSTIWTFGDIGNKNNLYRGEDSIKKFCESLIEHAMMISNFEKKKIIPLPRKKNLLYLNQTNCHICKKKSEDKYINDENYCKVRHHCEFTAKYSGAAHSICNLKYSIPKEIPMFFHNGHNYDYCLHFKTQL